MSACSYCITEALQVYRYNITCIYKPIKLLLLIPVCSYMSMKLCCCFHGVKYANKAKFEPAYVAGYSYVSIQLAS